METHVFHPSHRGALGSREHRIVRELQALGSHRAVAELPGIVRAHTVLEDAEWLQRIADGAGPHAVCSPRCALVCVAHTRMPLLLPVAVPDVLLAHVVYPRYIVGEECALSVWVGVLPLRVADGVPRLAPPSAPSSVQFPRA